MSARTRIDWPAVVVTAAYFLTGGVLGILVGIFIGTVGRVSS